jgi:hypothetical protein
VQRRRATLQLRHVLDVLRHERRAGSETVELADRAAQVVEYTAVGIEPEPDEALLELLEYARHEVAELRARVIHD